MGHDAGIKAGSTGSGGCNVSGFNALVNALLPVARAIDNFNRTIGKYVAWLIFAAVLVSA